MRWAHNIDLGEFADNLKGKSFVSIITEVYKKNVYGHFLYLKVIQFIMVLSHGLEFHTDILESYLLVFCFVMKFPIFHKTNF